MRDASQCKGHVEAAGVVLDTGDLHYATFSLNFSKRL
jgi:hypothetical protein